MAESMADHGCSIAFKEWAVVCAAVLQGRQSILLRKGGIHEGIDGFRVAHSRFWLFPTAFHQAGDKLNPAAGEYISAAAADQPPAGKIRLAGLISVERVIEIRQLDQALALAPLHILAEPVVRERFAYREPGLFVLAVRSYRTDSPYELADTPEFAGCCSWVDLRSELDTAGLSPVLNDEAHFTAMARLQAIVGG